MKTRHEHKRARHAAIISAALLLMVCSVPAIAGAAGESTYSTDTQVSVNGVTMTILAGSTAQSVTYTPFAMGVLVGAGNSFTIQASGTNNIMYNNDNLPFCNGVPSRLTITGGTLVTITPAATGCPLPVTPTTPPVTTGGVTVLIPSSPTQLITTPQQTIPTPSPTPTQLYQFTTTLKIGAVSDDVKHLQMFLNSHNAQVTTSGDGSPGNEITTFGKATKKALAKYQKANNIPATGFFGPITMKFVNSILGRK